MVIIENPAPWVLKVIVALPAFFLVLMEKVATPNWFVFRLEGLTVRTFLPALSSFALTFAFGTKQPPSPNTHTVIASLYVFDLLMTNEKGNVVILEALHPAGVGKGEGVGCGVGVGDAFGVWLGTGLGDGVGDAFGVGVGISSIVP